MIQNRFFLGGFRIDEEILQSVSMHCIGVDIAIIVIGWESRSFELLKRGAVSGKRCILVSFDGDEICETVKSDFETRAKELFTKVDPITMCNAYDHEKVMSETDALVESIADDEFLSCLVDYTSMPKLVTQTLFRRFMIEGVCPRVKWAYCSGLYDSTPFSQPDFHQGVKRFFAIRGAEGGSGISNTNIGILALGADRALITAFLRENSYDKTYFLHASSEHSPELMARIAQQREWLQKEFGVAPNEFIECKANTVLETLKTLVKLLHNYPEQSGAAIDAFCSGPKSHAIAASALVSAFPNVRLVGRVPVKYRHFEVKPSGEISVTTVSDFTNPIIAQTLIAEFDAA